MAATTEYYSSSRIPKWSGKGADYKSWSLQFEAYINTQGYEFMLDDGVVVPRDSDPAPLAAGELIIYKGNTKCFGYLIQAMDVSVPTGELALRELALYKTDDNKRGHFPDAWRALKEANDGTVTADLTKEWKKYSAIKMEHDRNPKYFMMEMLLQQKKIQEIRETTATHGP
jgi:hypothetical protein